MKRLRKVGMTLFILGILLNGCSSSGGGGGGGTPSDVDVDPIPQPTAKISGSVSGTTIIAVNDNGDIVVTDPTDTVERFLSRNNALALNDASKLAEAKNLIIGGVNDTLSAIDSILAEAETDPIQTDDFVNFSGDEEDTPESIAAEIAEARSGLDKTRNCLDGSSSCVDDNGTPLDTSDDVEFTLQPLFGGLVDFNSLLPVFTGDIPGLFPGDGTIEGSIISGANINEDINPANGIPDILDDMVGGCGSASGGGSAPDPPEPF